LQQAVTQQDAAGRLPEAERTRLRRLLLIAAAACVPFILAQLALAVFVTPIFADMYAEAGIESPSAIWRLVFSLSHGPGLALLIVGADAALFGVAYLIARRTRPWVLFVPVGVLAIAAGAYVPFLYMPLFSSMNVVH
jgi:hypothetical protein